MSGIAGVFFRDGRPVHESHVGRMLQEMSYRGPDGSGVWTEGSVGLGHLMLHVTPESLAEKLPMQDNARRFVITADARIDNRAELFSVLGILGSRRAAMSDSELILCAHEKWNTAGPGKLVGDFVYCTWDRRDGALFLCRDAFGVRPLYYYIADRVFAFASEIRPLLTLRDVPRRLNEVMVADYLVGMEDDQAITFYSGIHRLPPGCFISVTVENTSIQKYWSLNPSYELRLPSSEQYAEALRDLFTEAVRCRLRCSKPVATTLSGGLDSSSVACVARDFLVRDGRGPLRTLSLVYDHVHECDERQYINAVVAHGDLEPHFVHADRAVPLPYFGLTDEYSNDDLFDSPNSFSVSGMELLRELGIRVVLDGFDGDNTISHGYAYLSELANKGKLIVVTREIQSLCARNHNQFWDVLWRKAIRPLTPAVVRRTYRRVTGHGNRPWPREALISSEFAKRIGLAERYREVSAYSLKPLRDCREDHCRSLAWGGLTQHLESMNKISARYSVVPGHPFFDRRLAEFCVALPHCEKISDGWTRLVFRKAMAGVLPEEVQWRVGKVDFRPSFNYAVLSVDRFTLETTVRSAAKVLDGYVDEQAILERYNNFLSNPLAQDPSYLWFALALGLWMDRTGLRA